MTPFELGAQDAMTKIASAAFGGLAKVAPAVNTVLGTTARSSRAQIRGTKRTVVKPPQHKPTAVSTPAPAPPRVEPTTITPTQPPAQQKLAAVRKKMKRNRGSAGEPMRPGEDMRTRKTEPGNEPVTHVNGAPHDF